MRARKVGEWPPVTSVYAPADYVDELNRGTVEYDPTWQNYSFHSVTIPDGSVIKGCNFTQAAPATPALHQAGSASYVECNLTNAAVSPIKGCTHAQMWLTATDPLYLANQVKNIPVIATVPVQAVLPGNLTPTQALAQISTAKLSVA